MRLRTATVLSVLFLAGAGLAGAQDQATTGAIQGRLIDPQGLAVPGAAVTATGPQGARTATTDSEGRFNLPFLTPGVYGLLAQLPGFKTVERQDLDVHLAQTVDMTLKLEVGGVAETVLVAATSPVVDTATTTVGTMLDSEMLARLPVGRGLADVIYIAPGVSSGGGTGDANASIAGASGFENQYVVDGMNITNVGFGTLGSYGRGTLNALGSGVPYDFMQEVQIKTGGYEAEYGQSTGGVVNVITKSGSNTLRGSLFGYGRPATLESSRKTVTTQNGFVNTTGSQVSDGGAQVGGPLIKDRVFFFGAIDPQWSTTSFIAPDGFPLRRLGSVDRKRQFVSYAAKSTVQLTPNHRFDVSVFGDPGSGDPGPQRSSSLRGDTTSAFSKIDRFGSHNQTVKYDGVLSASWLVEAQWARTKNSTLEVPTVDTWLVIDATTVPEGRSGGLGPFENNEGVSKQYQVKATNLFAGHRIRYGAQFEDVVFDDIPNYSGPTFTLPNGTQTVTGALVAILPDAALGKVYRVIGANFKTLARHTTQQYTNVFVEDTWKIGDRLTFRPGIRYERQKLVGTLGTGAPNSFTWDNNWAPRIGATYDPTGSGKAKIFGSWGRFYAKIPNDLAARSLSEDSVVQRADYYDAALTQPIPSTVRAAGTTRHFAVSGSGITTFDPNAKSTYLDESLVGVEYEAAPGFSVGVRYTHRTMPRVLEDIGTAAMALYYLPQYQAQLASVEFFVTNPRANYPATLDGVGAFEDPIHHYDAVELTATKRFSERWSLQASYRWSRLFGTFEGFYRNDNGQADPGSSSSFDFPTNDASYTQIGVPQFGFRGDIRYLGKLGAGPLPNDQPHQIKIYGTYNLPAGVNLGLGLQLSSGRPLTALAASPVYDSPGEIPEGPRGSGIQTVDGFKKRTPFQATLDAHLDYAIKLGSQRLVLLADIFNVGNLQRVLDYNNLTENSFGVTNPDYGAIGGAVTHGGYQTPQQVRIGARFEF